jgi:hypothetical protein
LLSYNNNVSVSVNMIVIDMILNMMMK